MLVEYSYGEGRNTQIKPIFLLILELKLHSDTLWSTFGPKITVLPNHTCCGPLSVKILMKSCMLGGIYRCKKLRWHLLQNQSGIYEIEPWYSQAISGVLEHILIVCGGLNSCFLSLGWKVIAISSHKVNNQDMSCMNQKIMFNLSLTNHLVEHFNLARPAGNGRKEIFRMDGLHMTVKGVLYIVRMWLSVSGSVTPTSRALRYLNQRSIKIRADTIQEGWEMLETVSSFLPARPHTCPSGPNGQYNPLGSNG